MRCWPIPIVTETDNGVVAMDDSANHTMGAADLADAPAGIPDMSPT